MPSATTTTEYSACEPSVSVTCTLDPVSLIFSVITPSVRRAPDAPSGGSVRPLGFSCSPRWALLSDGQAADPGSRAAGEALGLVALVDLDHARLLVPQHGDRVVVGAVDIELPAVEHQFVGAAAE